MLAFILILIISFAWAVVVNQIYLSNLNKILKFVLMLACLAISGVSTLFSIFLTPLFLSIFQKKQIKFDKRVAFVLAVLLSAVSFIDVKNRIVYEYKCNIEKDYEIIIIDNNFTLDDLDNMCVSFSNMRDSPKFTQKLNNINIYSDTNKTKIVAKIYNIYCPNSFILSGIQKEISGTEGGLFCGYTKTGLLEYNYELKQILKNKLIEKDSK
ncbi:hypothetical protein [Campylobacter sp. RM16190]|uniref:hypothetical protein n=1 Tax=Campylobacter sp. RM16190 TaxID=1705727 RepID=UPI001472C47C|nr:hypothetical protein [Campylobacter sp. RM16190]